METTKRRSNFELLRIFAMLMVVLFHIQRYGPLPQLYESNEFFSSPVIYLRLLILEIGAPFGAVANSLFIIISGYFMNANDHIDTGKIAKKLLLQLGFAAIILIIANSVWAAFFKNDALLLGKVTIEDFNAGWWYIGYYFFVIVLAKLILNRFTAKLTQKQFTCLLLTILAVTQFSWSGSLLDSLASESRTLLMGVFFFLMGGYIARYNPFKNLKTYTYFLIIAATYAIRFLSQYNIVSQSIDAYYKTNLDFHQNVQDYMNYEISAVILAISLFELFRRWNIPNNAVINYIGRATLMIYFIHENTFFTMFYKNADWMGTLSKSCLLYCLKWLKWAAIAFAAGLAAYELYTLLGKLLPRMRSWFVVQESSD